MKWVFYPIDWHITYDGARLPFTTFDKFPFSVVSLCLYCFWNPSFKLPVSWPISSGLYLLCMAWCTWKTQLSPIWLILALQDVKSSIQFCACCGAPLGLMPLIYNQWLSTLPVLLSTFVQPLNDTSNLTTPWVCPQHERAIISDP